MHAPVALSIALCLLGGCAGMGWEGDPRLDGLQAYKAAFRTALGDSWQPGPSLEQFERDLHKARVLFLGDDHRDHALHRLQRELLERLARRGLRLCFVLEAIGAEDDELVAAHLRGALPEPALRAAIARRWPDSWLDSPQVDAPHYRDLLALAARIGAPVHGLEPAPRLPLRQRDPWIAGRLHDLAARHGNRLLVVVVGQTHLLGQGDLLARAPAPAVALGARPTERLGPVPAAIPGPLPRTAGGLLYFRPLTAQPPFTTPE